MAHICTGYQQRPGTLPSSPLSRMGARVDELPARGRVPEAAGSRVGEAAAQAGPSGNSPPAPGEGDLVRQIHDVVDLLEEVLLKLLGSAGGPSPETPGRDVQSLLDGLQDNFGETAAPSPKKKPAVSKSRKSQAVSQDDAALAKKIDGYLEKHGSPAAGAGELFVQSGREKNVDPLLLLAIAGHETVYGTQGVGLNGMLGVGAYDDDPENSTRDPKFAGVANQLKVGAETFDDWRNYYGGSPSDSIDKQVQMVGQKWATDPDWNLGVMNHYRQIQEEIG